jgi:hypothetical protein
MCKILYRQVCRVGGDLTEFRDGNVEKNIFRVVEIIFFNLVTLKEEEISAHFKAIVTGRENLEDNLRGDVFFFPLFVRSAIAFGTTENHHDIRGSDNFGLSLNGIPEKIACNEDVRLVDIE